MNVTVKKIWDDEDNAAGLRPAILKVTLSNGNSYYLSEENGWTVTVKDLPKYKEGKPVQYTWSEQSVAGYTKNEEITGDMTVFTNHCVVRKGKRHHEFDDMPTALGIGICLNHVGDNFE